jgi:small subunit ribosomal protein S7
MYTHIPVGSTPLLEKFLCSMMLDGKKTVVREIMQDVLEELKKAGHKNPVETFETALRMVMPQIEVRPKRVGGAVYQIPMEVNSKRQQSLAIRWILTASRKKKGKPMYKKLSEEILDALSEQGEAYKKKIEVKKMAEANKAFAHLANY